MNNIRKFISDAKIYWKRPPAGRYMPYKEIVSYAVGGIGAYFLIYVIQQLTLAVNNFIIGNVIGIQPGILYVIYVISVISGFPSTAIRATIIDNTRNKKGKYRPYIMSMGIPTCILAIGFVLVPYENIESQYIKAAIILLFNIGFQFFYMFFYDSYENLIMVLSPNTIERSDATAVKAIVYSIAPSITTAVIPIAAKFLTGGSITNFNLYRILYPIFSIIGILLSTIVYANTQEKIVQARTHAVQIKFFDALKAVAKNKYFWIISLAGWLGFLESSYGVILNWLYEYKKACSPEEFTIIGLIYGNASFWGMLFAPFAIRRFGKRNVLVFTNIMNIFFIALMYPIIEAHPENMIWMVLICLFMNGVVGAFAHILTPSLNADIRDYQQFVTGERIDGMFSTVGLIGSVITLLMSGVLPTVYTACGINETTLAQKSGEITQIMTKYLKEGETLRELITYDVLYIDSIFDKVMLALIMLSVVGAIINVVPYFFYDLSEVRQQGMVKVLKLRALFEDYGNNALSDRDLVEAIDMINEAKEYSVKEPVETNKKALKEKLGVTGKELRKACKEARELNEKIEVSKIVVKELNKFSDPVVQVQFEQAKKIYAAGLAGLTNVQPDEVERARALPASNEQEKAIRKNAIELAKLRRSCAHAIITKHDGKIEAFDTSIFEPLFEKEDTINDALTDAYLKLSDAKKAKDKEKVLQIKETIKELKAERKVVAAKIKDATEQNSVYTRLAKPYTDAKRLVVQEENYQHYDEIVSMYDEAKVRADEQRRKEEEEFARLEAEKEAYAAQLKAEKLAAKQAKKKNKKDDK